MEIAYQGGMSFVLRGNQTVAINPSEGTEQTGIVLFSERQDATRCRVSGPGEYEMGGVLIVTLETGTKPTTTLANAVELDGMNVLHLGRHVNPLTEKDLLAIGKVDVLLLPADDLQAAQAVIVDLAPRVVVPFGPHAVELCGALGVKRPQAESHFTWNGTGKAPSAVLLRARKPRKRAGVAARKKTAA